MARDFVWKGIVNVSNWAVNKITKPCFAEIKSCPKTVTMGAAPSTEVKVKVEVLSVLFLENISEGKCKIQLQSETSDGAASCHYCNGHTQDGLHCFKLSLKESGIYSLNVKHEGEILNQRGLEVNVTVLPPPLDHVKSTYNTGSSVLIAGDSIKVTVSLLDEQGQKYNKPVQLSYFIRLDNQPEKCIHSLHSTRAESELDVVLLQAGETHFIVRADGKSLTFSVDRFSYTPKIDVMPNRLYRISFSNEACSLRGDGLITHDNNQLWVGVPYIVSIQEGYDRYNNKRNIKTRLTGRLEPKQSVKFEIIGDKVKLVISTAGVFRLILSDFDGNAIMHNLPALKVAEVPLDCSRSTFEVFCRDQNLTAGESVKIKIILRNVEGNSFKGMANMAVFNLCHGEVTPLIGPVKISQSKVGFSPVLIQSGTYQFVIEANGQSIEYIGTSFGEDRSVNANMVKVSPAKLHRIEMDKYAHSIRGDGKIQHASKQLWVGVKFIVAIKKAFDQFDNRRPIQNKLFAMLNPKVSDESLFCANSEETLELVIRKPGKYNLILKSEGNTIKHNLPKLSVDQPPIDIVKSSYKIEARNSTLKAGEDVLLKVDLRDVQGNSYKGSVELSFFATCEKGNEVTTECRKTISIDTEANMQNPERARQMYITDAKVCFSQSLKKSGTYQLITKANGHIIKYIGTSFVDEGLVIQNRIRVIPEEAKKVFFKDVAYTMGDQVKIRHPVNQLWINHLCKMTLTRALDAYGNKTNLPKKISASLKPKNATNSLSYDTENKTIKLFVKDPGCYQLMLTSIVHELNHNVQSLTVLSPSKAKLTVLPMYDVKYAEDKAEDSLPLVGKPFMVRIEFDHEMQHTFTQSMAFIRNSDGKAVDKFQYWKNTKCIRDMKLDSPGLVSDVIWLKLQDIQTDAGVKIRGLDEFDEESVEVKEYPEYRIMCYHGNCKVHPKMVCGDDNANLHNIARVTDVLIEAKDVTLDEIGVSINIDTINNEGYEDVYDMIKLLLVGNHYRHVASHHDRKRRHFASQTDRAYFHNESVKDVPTCTVLKSIKDTHADIMELANNKAMDAYFEFHNRKRPLSEIDLHDLRAYKSRKEKIPGEAIDKLVERLNDPRLLEEYEWLEIIVGAGKHSESGKPQIRPLVEEFLQENGSQFLLYCQGGNRYDVINKGSLLITFKKYSGEEPCYGQFYCSGCDKVWWSRYSWSGYKQTCLRCKETQSLPYKMSMEQPSYGPRKNKMRSSKLVHYENMCEKCQEIGFLCINIKNVPLNL